MASAFRDIDDFVIDRVYQPVVDRLSSWFGISRYTGAMFAAFVSAFPFSTDIAVHDGQFRCVIQYSVIPTALCFYWWLGRVIFRAQAVDESASTVLPRYRLHRILLRMGWSVLVFLNFSAVPAGFGLLDMAWNSFGALAIITALYLPACYAGPPPLARIVAAC